MNPSILYRDYKPALIRVCSRLIRDPRDREELVNDAFVKAFQKWDSYDPRKSTPYTWMRSITLNGAISFLRQRSWEFRELTEEFERSVYPSTYFNQEIFLGCLMPATAKVFRLYAIEGYSHKEISEMLGISDGTSKWHLSEARRILREKINK